MSEYHRMDSCNSCGEDNYYEATDTCDGFISEAKTKCSKCGFIDYWAYGYFESGSEIESKCKKYYIDVKPLVNNDEQE